MSEVLNGLMSRSDSDAACKTPIGHIPAGSGNGFAASVLDECGSKCSPLEAALNIVSARVGDVDCIHVRQKDKTFHGILSVTWTLISDIDVESERLQSLGSVRIDIYSLLRIMSLRSYEVRLETIMK